MPVYLVGAGPGDPGLLTRRGAALLANADVVVYDRLVDRSLLELAPPGAELIDAGKWPVATVPGHGPTDTPIGRGAVRQDDINALLVARGLAGEKVVRLKGGDPFLFGRGGEEAAALAAAGVPWEVVPGVTSATAAPEGAGIPVTHRGLATSVTVVTGHVGDETDPGSVNWELLARTGGTIVVLMGMAVRAEIARRLQVGGMGAATPVAVVQWASTERQQAVRTTLDELPRISLGSPAVIIIGAVAGLELDVHVGRPLAGWTVVVTRAEQRSGSLVDALRDAGARVLEVPTVVIADPEDGGAALADAARRVGEYDWVVFTSANAVHRLLGHLRDGRAFGRARLAAVGSATASALAEHGLMADLVPDRSTAEGLGAVVPPALTGGKVLFPRSAIASNTLVKGLTAKGWAVDDVVAYRTESAGPPPDHLRPALEMADAITFTSPSTVAAYRALADSAGQPLPVPPVVACIGPVTAAAARSAGLGGVLGASTPSVNALVAALVSYRAETGIQ